MNEANASRLETSRQFKKQIQERDSRMRGVFIKEGDFPTIAVAGSIEWNQRTLFCHMD